LQEVLLALFCVAIEVDLDGFEILGKFEREREGKSHTVFSGGQFGVAAWVNLGEFLVEDRAAGAEKLGTHSGVGGHAVAELGAEGSRDVYLRRGWVDVGMGDRATGGSGEFDWDVHFFGGACAPGENG
jgi:hypothetical protein